VNLLISKTGEYPTTFIVKQYALTNFYVFLSKREVYV